MCTEELFRLGPEELGKLEDKDKPDATVCARLCGCPHTCELLSIKLEEHSVVYVCVGACNSFGVAESVCSVVVVE